MLGSGPTRLSPRVRLTTALIALAAVVAAAACDDSATEVESDPIFGSWVGDAQGGTFFLEITESQIIYYAKADTEQCAERTIYDMEPLGGNDYLLTSTVTPLTVEAQIIVRDGELTWQTAFGTAVFYPTTLDLSTLSVCAGGGDDPALTCTELPAIEPGQDVSGSLTQDDALERGRYYDVYAFQPQAQSTVDITLASTAFDVYLYVYDAAGTLLAENDDAVEGSTDAGLTLQVVPGCYRIEATSLATGATGSYTLRID